MFRDAILIAAVLSLVACGGSSSRSDKVMGVTENPGSADLKNGKAKFVGTCASCHGPEGKGMPNLGKDLTISPWVKTQSDEQLLAFVKRGRPAFDPLNTTHVDMPPRGGNPALKDQDLVDIIAFVRSIERD